ncbi:MAG: outer membrane beta-barrel domain-containing protein [Myxococcales bacterium]|nr:outer membrane beta-barrel domain-containing protein [Myxococcales bacterium]
MRRASPIVLPWRASGLVRFTLLQVLLGVQVNGAQAQPSYVEGPDPEEPGQKDEAAPPGDQALRIPCLEDLSADGASRKGVQVRPFLKDKRFEVTALGGLHASDVLSSTYTFGGAVGFYPSEDLGLELLVTHAPVRYQLEEPFSAFDRERRFEPGRANQAILSLLFVPMQAKFRFGEDTIVPADVFVVAGAGRTFHDSVLGVTWAAGLGARLFLGDLVALRLEVRDFVTPQEVLGSARIANNVALTFGVGVWLP